MARKNKGRVLSGANETLIREATDLIGQGAGKLTTVLDKLATAPEAPDESGKETSMKKPMIDAALLAQAKGPLARRSAFNFMAKTSDARTGADQSWYRIAAADAAAPGQVDILLYSEIGMWGIGADQFVADLANVNAHTINLHVNSPGGSVFDGLAIYNSLVQHPANIIAHVDGWAASIASVIICAADTINIGAAAQIMIHQPFSICMGSAADMRLEASVLDKIEQSIIGIYAARTGGDPVEIAAQMAAETWFLGSEAVESGYADVCVPNKTPAKPAAKMNADFFGTIFPHLPEQVRANLHSAASVDEKSVKGFDFEHGTRNEFEDFLRASSASGKRAKAITNTGFKPVTQRPVDAKQIDQPTATDRPGDAVRRAATVAAIWNATRAFPH